MFLLANIWKPLLELISQFFLTTFTSNLPVIAAINGAAPAAGCVLACCSDYRIMINHPKFIIGLNEVKMGLAVPWSGIKSRDGRKFMVKWAIRRRKFRNRVLRHMRYPLNSLRLGLWQLSLDRGKQNMHARQANCSLVRRHLIGGLLTN